MADIELSVGDKAPAFTLKDQKKRSVKLSDFRGKKVALYFYPEDDTPGCTKQACSLRDDHQTLRDNGIVVLGISPDDVQTHVAFTKKYELPFTLLADPSKKVLEKYGAWGEKNMYGKKVVGVRRRTFLIDEDGKIHNIIKRPNTKDHGNEVIKKFGLA